jgi:hypothetical protein
VPYYFSTVAIEPNNSGAVPEPAIYIKDKQASGLITGIPGSPVV